MYHVKFDVVWKPPDNNYQPENRFHDIKLVEIDLTCMEIESHQPVQMLEKLAVATDVS